MAAPWTTCTPKKVEEICALLEQGEPLAVICRREDMPSVRTVYNWQDADQTVKDRFQQARDIGEDAIAANLRTVARGGDGSTGDVQRDKLVVDTDLKLLAKWNPRRWGDRVQLAGHDNGALFARASELDDEELAAIVATGRGGGTAAASEG